MAGQEQIWILLLRRAPVHFMRAAFALHHAQRQGMKDIGGARKSYYNSPAGFQGSVCEVHSGVYCHTVERARPLTKPYRGLDPKHGISKDADFSGLTLYAEHCLCPIE